MATPTKHAVCSASSSDRWTHCTAAPRFEEQFPESISEYAAEGTLAHSICELYGQKKFSGMTTRKFNAALNKLKKDPLYKDEMLKTAEAFVQYLAEKSMTFAEKPHIAQEVKVNFTDYAPEGFGTCDCIMIGGNRLHITDYKHGKGVAVSAKANSQMRLYALGALALYGPLYDIRTVSMAIVQPRIHDDVEEDEMTVDELKAWGDTIRPLAQAAYMGTGTFEPGPWCKFCRGAAACRANAAHFSAFEDFKDCVIAGELSPDEVENRVQEGAATTQPAMLSDAEVANLLTRAKGLADWYDALKDYATRAILLGRTLPGWKVVAGKSNRAFTDADAAIAKIKDAGFDEAVLYERKAKTLTQLESLVGKKDFAALVGDLITKPVGKPTLANAEDRRESYSPAAADFSGVGTS